MAVVLVGGAAPGCAPSAGAYCRKVCDCTGCDAAAEAECVDDLSDAQHRASKKECGDKFNAYFSCIDGQTKCVGGALEVEGCESEGEALVTCAGDIGLNIGVTCQVVCQRTEEECGGGGSQCLEGCGSLQDLGQAAGCTLEFQAFLTCYNNAENICNGAGGCDSEISILLSCTSEFCSQNPSDPSCQ